MRKRIGSVLSVLLLVGLAAGTMARQYTAVYGPLPIDGVEIDRGALLTVEDLDAMDEPYRRYRVTESGVSPRATPGHPNAVWVSSANEHDEFGAVSEDAQNRIAHRKNIGTMFVRSVA